MLLGWRARLVIGVWMVTSTELVRSRSWGLSRRFVLEGAFHWRIEGIFNSRGSFTVVPEPSFYLVSFSVLMGMAILHRRRHSPSGTQSVAGAPC